MGYVKLLDKGISWNEETKLEEINGQLEGRLPIVKVEPEPPPMIRLEDSGYPFVEPPVGRDDQELACVPTI